MHSTYNIHNVSFKSHPSRKHCCICLNVKFFTHDKTPWKHALKLLYHNTVTMKLTSLWRGMDKDYFDGNIMNQCYSTGFLWVQKTGKSPGLPTVILKVSSKATVFWLWSWRWDQKTLYFNSGPEVESKSHTISITLEIQSPKV